MMKSFGQVRATMLRPSQGERRLWKRDWSQHVSTGAARRAQHAAPNDVAALKCCDHLAGACKYWVNNVAICCIKMLRSFGRGLIPLGGNAQFKRHHATSSLPYWTTFTCVIQHGNEAFVIWISRDWLQTNNSAHRKSLMDSRCAQILILFWSAFTQMRARKLINMP